MAATPRQPSAELIALVAAARSGDLGAQSELVRRYLGRVSAFVRPIIMQPSAVEDVAQTVFIKMVRRLGELRQPVTFESWLFTMARNAALDFVRHRRCRPATVCEEEALRQIPDSGSLPALVEITEALNRALAHLSPRDRRLVSMIVEGTSYRVAAEREGLSVGAVKVRLNRVRPFLRVSVGAAIGIPTNPADGLRPPPRSRVAA